MLVWSEARNAEGEKGNTDAYFKHTPKEDRVPTASSFFSFKDLQTEQALTWKW